MYCQQLVFLSLQEGILFLQQHRVISALTVSFVKLYLSKDDRYTFVCQAFLHSNISPPLKFNCHQSFKLQETGCTDICWTRLASFTGVAPFLLVVYVPPRFCYRAELLQEAGAREQNILRFLSGRSEHWWQVTLQHLHLLFRAILALTKYHVEFVPFSSSPSFLAGLTLCTVSKDCKTCVRKCSLLIFNFFVLAYQLA